MAAYYNEFDPYAAQWLRNLITAGHIAPGVVDERSIEDVHPSDLRGFEQCHFFAGIGVWSLALRRAGWPDDRPVWTGSCPCQPFSQAGEGAGFDDERHLWPHFQWLIAERRPAVVFGEQVASRDAGPWIDLVQDDLEGMGYGVGAVAFPSAGIGAPHIRDRLYWMAHASGKRRGGRQGVSSGGVHDRSNAGWRQGNHGLVGSNQAGVLSSCRLEHAGQHDDAGQGAAASPGQPQTDRSADIARGSGLPSGGLGNTNSEYTGWDGGNGDRAKAAGERTGIVNGAFRDSADMASRASHPGPTNGYWAGADWLFCRDGKWRPVEPSTFPLAHGAPARVGRLRAYGNAINAQQAQIFIEAAMSCMP